MSPFFIFFVSRSGSTYLANLLAKNTDAVIIPESNFVTNLIQQYGADRNWGKIRPKRLCQFLYAESKFHDLQIPESELRSRLEGMTSATSQGVISTICEMYAQRMGNIECRVGFKKGNYIKHYQSLAQIFPDAKYVIMLRDGRAVFNSQRSSIYSQTGKPFETDVSRAAESWRSFVVASREVAARLGDSAITVNYESVVADPDGVVSDLSRFLGLKQQTSDDAANSYEVAGRYGELHRNIHSGPLSERTTAWSDELSVDEIRTFETIAGDELVSCGYSLTFEDPAV